MLHGLKLERQVKWLMVLKLSLKIKKILSIRRCGYLPLFPNPDKRDKCVNEFAFYQKAISNLLKTHLAE